MIPVSLGLRFLRPVYETQADHRGNDHHLVADAEQRMIGLSN